MKKNILSIIFSFLIYLGFSQDTNKTIDSLFALYQSTTKAENKCEALNELGLEYLSVNLDSSVFCFKKLIRNAISIKNDTLHIKGNLGLAKAFTSQAKLDSAVFYFDVSEKLLTKVDNVELEKGLYINKGITFFYKSKYGEASKEFEKALLLAIKHDDIDTQSRCYNNIALCKSYQGDFKTAIEMHLKSAEIAGKLNDNLGLAQSYNNIGLVYKDLDEHEKANEYLLKSLELKKKYGNKVDVVGSLLNLGVNRRNIGAKEKDSIKLNKAKEYFLEALELSEATGYIRGRNTAYVNLALVEISLENYDNAVEFGKRSLNASIESKSFDEEMISRINLGDAYRYKKQYHLAEEQLMKGLRMAEESGNLYVKKEALEIISLLKDGQNQYKEALKYYREFYAIQDSISSKDVKNKVNELEAKYQNEQREKEIQTQRAEIAEKELKLNRKNTQIVGLVILAIVVFILGYLLYNQQKLKNMQLRKESELKEALVEIETHNKLQEQRLRISRDLHDNIGAQLTFVISSIENLQYGFKITNEKLKDKLINISAFTKETIYELRDTIWAMNKNEITLDDLKARISNFIDKANVSSGRLTFNINVQERTLSDYRVSSVIGMNIYRIIQEAVNNAMKHANASTVNVDVRKQKNKVVFSIKDDGKGFDINTVEEGNGLSHMKKRAQDIDADIVYVSNTEGTEISLSLIV